MIFLQATVLGTDKNLMQLPIIEPAPLGKRSAIYSKTVANFSALRTT
jgi:hypothetical protein